jgi:hypothetical protein
VIAALLLAGTVAEPAGASAELDTYHRRLEHILARPEFATERSLVTPLELRPLSFEPPRLLVWLWDRGADAIETVVEWLDDWFGGKRHDRAVGGRAGRLASAAAWSMAAGALLVAALAGVRAWRRRGARPTPHAAGPSVRPAVADALARSPAEWDAAAEELAARGELRAALLACYAALLVRLHQRQLVRYGRARTNGEYVRDLRGHAAHAPFARLSGVLDRTCYADAPVDPDTFRIASDWVRAVDGATVPVS